MPEAPRAAQQLFLKLSRPEIHGLPHEKAQGICQQQTERGEVCPGARIRFNPDGREWENQLLFENDDGSCEKCRNKLIAVLKEEEQ